MFAMLKKDNRWKILIAIFSLILFSSLEFQQGFSNSDSNFNCLEIVSDSEEEITDDNHGFGFVYLPFSELIADFRWHVLFDFHQFRLHLFSVGIYRTCARYIQFRQLRIFS